jgi:hypothetical protein
MAVKVFVFQLYLSIHTLQQEKLQSALAKGSTSISQAPEASRCHIRHIPTQTQEKHMCRSYLAILEHGN